MSQRKEFIFNKASKRKKHFINTILGQLYGLMELAKNTQFLLDGISEFFEVPQEEGVEHPIAEQYQKSKKQLLEHREKMRLDLADIRTKLFLSSKNKIVLDIKEAINYLAKIEEGKLEYFFKSEFYNSFKTLAKKLPHPKIKIILDELNKISQNPNDAEFNYKQNIAILLESLKTIFKDADENKLEKVILSDLSAIDNVLSSLVLDKDYKILNNVKLLTKNFNECLKQINGVVSYLILLAHPEDLDDEKQIEAPKSQIEKLPIKDKKEQKIEDVMIVKDPVSFSPSDSLEPTLRVYIPPIISKPAECWIKNDKDDVVLSLRRSYQEMLNVVDELVDEKKASGQKTQKARTLKEQEKILNELIKIEVKQCSPEDLKYLNKKDELDIWFSTKKERPYNPLPEVELPKHQDEILFVIQESLTQKYRLSCKIAALKAFIPSPPDKKKVDELITQEKRLGLISDLYQLKLKAIMSESQFKTFQNFHTEWLRGQTPPPKNIIIPSDSHWKNGFFTKKVTDKKKEGIEALIERKSNLHAKITKASTNSFYLVPNIARKKIEIEFIDEILKNYTTGNNLDNVIANVIKSFKEQNKPIDFLDTSKFLKNKTGKIVQSIRTGVRSP